jgi:uridine kinase
VHRDQRNASGEAIDKLREYLSRMLLERGAPLVVAIDGRSGAGKSTIASQVAAAMNAALIPGDDFFAAEITSADWGARTPRERARDAIDWRRLRRLALEPLRAGRPAVWNAFDFFAGVRADGSYGMSTEPVRRDPAPVIILDGVYSARPEFADLVDCTILVEAPGATRQARLARREDAAFLEAWHERWDAAEDYYFTQIRPPSSFDLVVDSVASRVSVRSEGYQKYRSDLLE